MSGPLALIGGEEFTNAFDDVHASLLEIAREAAGARGGDRRQVRVVYLPFNMAEDGAETIECWSEEARSRLEKLGALVSAPPISDRCSADDPVNARVVRQADWIYIGGGKPQVGMRVFAGSETCRAMMDAYRQGALLSGASAGAMILADSSWVITPELDQSIERSVSQGKTPDEFDLPKLEHLACLGVLPRSLVWPHLNQFFSMRWLKSGMKPAGHTVIGIDEQTALVGAPDRRWKVFGRGRVTLIDDNYQMQSYNPESELHLGL
jgi:cyanophycinase-like exopeptidase